MTIVMLLINLSEVQAETRLGLGVVLGYPTGFTVQTEKISSIQVGYSLGKNHSSIRGNVDQWFYTSSVSPESQVYVGAGITAGLAYSPASFELELGARVPIGLQYFPNQNIELFMEWAPIFYVFPSTTMGFSPAIGMRVYFPVR